MPQEKSNLYLIFVLMEIFCNILPIYSAIDINLVEYKVNFIGSTFSCIFFIFFSQIYFYVYLLRCMILFLIFAIHPYFKRIEEVEDNSNDGPII